MRRAFWIAGIVIAVGIIAALVCRLGCGRCCAAPDEAGADELEDEQGDAAPDEEPVQDAEEG